CKDRANAKSVRNRQSGRCPECGRARYDDALVTQPLPTDADPKKRKPHPRYLAILSIAFASYWLAWAIHPKDFQNWVVENVLLVVFVAFLTLTRRRFPLSNVSYTLIAI